MKRITSIILTVVMVFALNTTAGAVCLSEKEYDDYLDGTIMTRGQELPSIDNFFDLSDDRYDGTLSRCSAGLYTNYCFSPNDSGNLYVGWDVYAHAVPSSSDMSWTFKVSVYDMTTDRVVATKTSDPFHGNGVSNSHSATFTFTDLNTSHKYCVFFSCDETQVSGDVWVGHSYS